MVTIYYNAIRKPLVNIRITKKYVIIYIFNKCDSFKFILPTNLIIAKKIGCKLRI